ncbi:uncharacterized protein LOC111333793 [Stylophora pistillata]|uniref:GIY-YIG domain-containing protein n=1 Tax=Stylophora pistillata TaxID=50429 RepID=A0A2B4S161_STYPI|nr:uncharacterized protein LOC111333793 [Stylophora pistillata]PFX22789.1 hypothetical protein AWC38_SpisGene12687 [Stylophora pistillata]
MFTADNSVINGLLGVAEDKRQVVLHLEKQGLSQSSGSAKSGRVIAYKVLGSSRGLRKKIMEELPEDLRQLWDKQRYHKFLERIFVISNGIASEVSTEHEKAAFKAALPLVPELWKSKESQEHERIQEIYFLWEKAALPESLAISLAISANQYVKNVLCTESMERVDFCRIHKCLSLSSLLLIKLKMEVEQKINVEDAIVQERNSTGEIPSKDEKQSSVLQKISLKRLENLYIFPFVEIGDKPCQYPDHPGVYCIYYIGKSDLYEGGVKPSKDRPVYVGMSKISISKRLLSHQSKIVKARDLNRRDFIVRFMLVDMHYYACCVEEMLIEYFSPVWNENEAVKFSFGNADDVNNNWHKYHVEGDSKTKETMIKSVKDYELKLKMKHLSLATTSS